MIIGVPRYLLTSIAAVFLLFIASLGVYSIATPSNPAMVLVGLVLYSLAAVVSLLPVRTTRMPLWRAGLILGVVVAITLIVAASLDPQAEGGNGYATWYVAGAGVLLTMTAAWGRYAFAWAGTAFLVVHTVVWAGPAALVNLGVVGSVAWVAIAHLISSGMTKAARDAQRFALAEREATEWQALQEAHVHEWLFRLGQTSSMALAMLRQIEQSRGRLTAAERRECLHLEGAIRDEIRGRKLLNDAVRSQVMLARRRGAVVTLLDEGGIDALEDSQLDRVLHAVAAAIESTTANRVIARTAGDDSDVAVTVVGLRSNRESADGGERDEMDDDDEIVLWLEIPRHADSGTATG